MKGKLNNIEWIVLGLFGLLFDILQLILMFFFGTGLLVNKLIAGFFFIALSIYLFLRGYPLFGTKRLIRYLGGLLIEMVPVLNNFPTCSLIILLLASMEKGEGIIAKTAPMAGRILSVIEKRAPQFSGGKGAPRPRNLNTNESERMY